ncbi:sulfite exporter TauE/SafE family protein [Candidatus Uhrbacteria bacterium]|nr:sulfite exporter TauE/SafE family protein [Candidatus Uhrbacteria bacterium]
MEWINALLDGSEIAALTAFLLGVIVAVAPCPLAANVAAVGFLSRSRSGRTVWRDAALFTLGRGVSYTLVAALIYFGLSKFEVAQLFQGWGDKALGPFLILLGLVVAGAIKVDFPSGGRRWAAFKEGLAKRGGLGAFLLGAILALAICPYSGAIFFGALMPLVLASPGGLALPLLFGVGTSLPVAIFAGLIVFGSGRLGSTLGATKKMDRVMRIFAGGAMVAAGVYCVVNIFR